MKWLSVKNDGPPPFDELCVVRGKDSQYGYFKYALAYNECYRPGMVMTQVVELTETSKHKIPTFLGVPFEIEEYFILPTT